MTRYIRIFVLTLLFACSNSLLLAQVNYQPATVVNKEGKILNGQINYQNWERNPLGILFKQGENGKVIRYTPADIQSFQVEGDTYISAVVSVDKTPRETQHLTYASKPIIVQDTVFLSLYVKGKAKLYSLIDRDSKQHFYIEKDSSGKQELIYIRFLKEIQRNTTIQKNERYKGQLTYFFSECPGLKKQIQKLDYRAEDLIDLFTDFNQCVDPANKDNEVLGKGEDKAQLEIGFVAGATLTTIKFSSTLSYFDYLTQNHYSNSFNPGFGVSLNIILPRNRGKWAIYNEFTYKAYHFEQSFSQVTSPDYYINSTVKFGAKSIKMFNLLRYQIPDKKVRMFFQMGFSTGFVFSSENDIKIEKYFYDQYNEEHRKAIEGYRNIEIGVALGLGAAYRKFSFEFRYERANGMSNMTDLVSKSHTLIFLLGYHL
jgi:hypothetical protein